MVARFVRDEEAAGSNPVTPTDANGPLTCGNAVQGPFASLAMRNMCAIAAPPSPGMPPRAEFGRRPEAAVSVALKGHPVDWASRPVAAWSA